MANKRISELANATALTGAELIELVQGGVNVKSTAQDIANLGGGGGSWGSITGVLSNQTDLQTALNAKQDTITFGTGVQTALGVNIGSSGAPVLFGGALGTPSSGTATNLTGLPPTTGILGWPANSAGVLTNNGSGTLSWAAASSGITVGTTTITGGTDTRVLYNNAGVVGEYTTTGTGTELVKSASPAFTGNPTAPTQAPGDNSTKIATTAYVDALSLPAFSTSSNGYVNASGGAGRLLLGDNTWLAAGTSGNILTSNGTTWTSAAPTFWSLATGGTLTGANTITGTTTNIVKYIFNSLGVTHTDGAGEWLSNTTAAAAGNQQKSPATVWEGQGWKTNATAASQSVKWKAEVMPIQGAANPTSSLDFGSSINAGAYTNLFSVRSDITVPIIATGTGFHMSGGGISLASTAPGSNTITLPTSGTISGAQITMSSGNGASTFMVLHNGVYTPANGSTRHNTTISRGSFAPTSTYANGGITSHLIDPALDNNGNANDWTGIDMNPTLTDVASMTLYGMKVRPTASLSSFAHATPLSTVDIDGSFALDVTSTSTDLTLNSTHHTILVDATGAARTITLPTAASSARRIYTIKKIDVSANAVTLDGDGSETIDGATTQPINTQWEYLRVQSNGTAWFIIGND